MNEKLKGVIVTITNNEVNYGNSLQNYAVKEILEQLGLSVKTLNNQSRGTESELIRCFRKIKYIFILLCRMRKSVLIKLSNFNKFRSKYLNYTFFNVRAKITKKLDENIDYYFVGSDQIWNPNFEFNNHILDYIFLSNVDNEKKIAYAASFGVSDIPDQYKDFYMEGLTKFKAISVRESSGAEIVNKLANRKAEVLIDPTLMLSIKEWDKVSKKPKKVDFSCKYILTYFLGGLDSEKKEYIDSIGKLHDLKVYNLLDMSQPELYECGPAEFIYLFSQAELIMTDSFHACVFSFIYEKPFQVFERKMPLGEDMSSRIDTLLEKFDLQRKYVSNGLDNELFECDYQVGKERLLKEKEKSIAFLKKVIEK